MSENGSWIERYVKPFVVREGEELPNDMVDVIHWDMSYETIENPDEPKKDLKFWVYTGHGIFERTRFEETPDSIPEDFTLENELLIDFEKVWEADLKELSRHLPEKGLTYRDPACLNDMIFHLGKVAYKISTMANISLEGNLMDNPGELLDLRNMAGFVWLHLEGHLGANKGPLILGRGDPIPEGP